MDPTTRVILLYILGMLVGGLAAGGAVLIVQLGGADPINWRPILAAFLGPIVTGLISMRFPRPEGAQIADQVDTLKGRGVARRDMVVAESQAAKVRRQAAGKPAIS